MSRWKKKKDLTERTRIRICLSQDSLFKSITDRLEAVDSVGSLSGKLVYQVQYSANEFNFK